MGRLPKEKTEKTEDKSVNVQDTVGDVLKKFDGQHFNDVETPKYKVSSGSLNFDTKIGGGVSPSLVRLTGPSESGKTSCTLSFMTNFLKTVPDSYGVYIDAESRLNPIIKSRYPIKFVNKIEDFTPGTCFVLTTNSYEMSIDLMRQLVKTNIGSTKRFFFVVDSLDSLIPDDVANTNAEEVNQISGLHKAALTTRFLERFSMAMRKCGHIGFFISQVRSKIVQMYQKPDPNAMTNASGAHALVHGSDWVFEFQQHNAKTNLIIETVNGEDKILGHKCKIYLRKTQNDTSGDLIEYPIRRNAPIGKYIWREREVFDMLLAYAKVSKGGSWYTIDESIIKLLADKNIVIQPKYQGEDSFIEFLQENEEATNILYQHVLEISSALLSEY